MSRMKRLGALLVLGAGLLPIAAFGPIAATGRAERQDAEQRGVLAEAARRREGKRASRCRPGHGRWPGRCRARPPRCSGSIMSIVRKIPLDPKLRAEMRLVAAHANHCAYAEEYALADGRRAGLDDEAIEALRRGDFSGNSPAEKAALEFARKMTVNSASVTDESSPRS